MATSISFTMSGVSSCSGGCSYCSGALSQNYALFGDSLKEVYTDPIKMQKWINHIDERTYKEFKRDWDKVRKLFSNHKALIDELELAKRKGIKPFIHVDLWGANPLSCKRSFIETVNFIEEYFKDWDKVLSASDNGLGVYDEEMYDFIIKHDIKLQVSHDGIGEWMRLPIDVLSVEPYKTKWKKLAEKQIFNAINCTMSFYNNSFFKNIKYFNDVFKNMGFTTIPMNYIKLNHAYDSTYDLKVLNTEGRYNDLIIEELKGKPIGRWELHNGTNEWDRHALDDYMNEFLHLAIIMKDPVISNDPYYMPFKSYIVEQSKRCSDEMSDYDVKVGACRAYQRYKYKIGDSKSWDEQTFVICSDGNYSECNLIDSDHSVENPGGVNPPYCDNCKYNKLRECAGNCGSMPFPVECNYHYAWAQALMTLRWIDGCLSSNKNQLKNQIISNIMRGI